MLHTSWMKTLAQHKSDGTYREDRHGDYAPPDGMPVAPPWITDSAREVFDRLASQLAENGGVCEADGIALCELCELAVEVAELRKTINEGGNTTLTANGTVVQRVEVGMLNQKTAHYVKLLQQFGLTPKGRVGMRSGRDTSDPLVDMLAARGEQVQRN